MEIARINNRSNFIFRDYPDYHPESLKYIEFWSTIKRRVIEGYWGQDTKDPKEKGMWRFMPPQLYFYINLGHILHKKEGSSKTSPRTKVFPNLDDIDWDFSYKWLEARGFSGFKDDDEYTCIREVDLYNKGKIHIDDIPKSAFNKKGQLKKYTPARTYINKLFDRPLGLPLYDNEARNLTVLGSRGSGKDLEENTLVHSVSRGKIPIKNVKIGEFIWGDDGKPTKVIDKKYFYDQVQYKITLEDGRSLIAGEGHLWKVIDNYEKEYIIDTATIRDNYKNGYFLPINKPIEGVYKELPIEPYFLGLWLSSIDDYNTEIITVDDKVKDYIYEYIKKYPEYTNNLRKLNLLNNKHIPQIYLDSDYNQKLELLMGLMDSNGRISKSGKTIKFSTHILNLAEDVIKLLRILGIKTKYSTKISILKNNVSNGDKLKYSIKLKPLINVFKLSRKKALFLQESVDFNNSTKNKIAIKNVEKIGILPSVCIGVDNESHLFLAGDYIVTHNSYWAGNICILHEIITDGAKEYTEETIKNPGKVELFVGAAMASKSSDLLEKVLMSLNNLPGVWKPGTVDEIPSPLYKRTTGNLLQPSKIPWTCKYEKKLGGEWKWVGSQSSVKHGTWTIENPEAAAGGRYNVIVAEEFGLMPNSIQVHLSNIPTMYIEHKFGSALYLGTGGNIEKIQQSQIIFSEPGVYECLEFDDIWENTGKIGYFIPATYADRRFKDEEGNTKIDEATAYYQAKREKAKLAKSSSALEMEMMNYPLVPSEMFLNKSRNNYPIVDLKHRLSELMSNDKLLNSTYKGKFIISEDGEVKWKNENVFPIREYPLRNDDIEGCIEMFYLPQKNGEGRIPYGRYISSCLPPGEKVLTSSGLKSIETVTLSDKLINKDGKEVDIIKLLNYDVINEPTYTFKVANTFRTTTFTKEHPILTSGVEMGYISHSRSKREGINQRYKKFNFEFKTADKVNKGDWIKVPNIYKKENDFDINNLWINEGYRIDRIINSPLESPDFWWFIGIFLGDGWCNSNEYTIGVSFNQKESFYIDKFKNVINTLFGRSVSCKINRGANTCTFSHQQLSKFLVEHFGKKADDKRIPEWAKKIKEELKLNLLQGYLNSDGCITTNKGYYYAEFVSINLELLEAFQDILFSIDIISSITLLRGEKIHHFPGNYSCNTKPTYHLRLAHKDTINLALRLDRTYDHKLQKINFNDENIYKTQHQTIGCFFDETKDYIYFKINEIVTNTYTGIVYNFECVTNTFMCHHITTHNCDPIDDDGNDNGSLSLQSFFIYDLWTEKIVLEYSGRTRLAKDFYEQCRRALIYYNAKMLYENQKKGVFTYFDQKNSLYLLEDTPPELRDMDLQKGSTVGNKGKGVYATPAINKWGREQLAPAWMSSQAADKPEGVVNAQTLLSVGLIKEAMLYNPDVNADRISAFGLLMIFREIRIKYKPDKITKTKPSYIEDDFFKRTYNNTGNKSYNRLNFPGNI